MNEHREAMEAVDRAEALVRNGELEAARGELVRAAELEQTAADGAPVDRPKTRGILRISAVSLWARAGKLGRASELARRYLCEPIARGFARELHVLLNEIEEQRAGMERIPREPEERAAQLRARLAEIEAGIARGVVPVVPIERAA